MRGGERGRAAARAAAVPAADGDGAFLGGKLLLGAERQRRRRGDGRRRRRRILLLDAVGRVLTRYPQPPPPPPSVFLVVVIAIGVGRAAKIGRTAARLWRPPYTLLSHIHRACVDTERLRGDSATGPMSDSAGPKPKSTHIDSRQHHAYIITSDKRLPFTFFR